VVKRQAKQCTTLVLPYGVKQTAKRQAKQCTALFCPHSLIINSGLVDKEQLGGSFTFSAKSKTADNAGI
jgi:hypothetical protein